MTPQTNRFTIGRRFALPAVTIAAALLLTGCSGNDGKVKEAEESPLQKYLSVLYDEDQFTQEKLDAEMAKTEELVAECMTKEGFEYTPSKSGGGMVIMNSEDEGESEGPEWGSLEFAKEYGYGIVNWPGMDDAPEEPEDPSAYEDPNEDYVNSLSESEQAAYYETLYGAGPDESEINEDGSYEYRWQDSGCQGWAQNEINESNGGVNAAFEDPEFAELFTEMNEVHMPFYDDTQASPEVQALNTSWNACMTKAGISEFASPNSVFEVLNNEYYALMPEDGDMSKADKGEVDKFQAREIETAVADITCKEQVKYDAEIQKLTNAAEQEFIDANKPQLDALVAKYGAKKK
ncbi:hypothetical protein [Leucobacter sp. 1207-22]|uniref:hypothetical protein n=1 Tax=Leucobacter sp. 1207-22 TaxID=2604456 RepID=UPI004062C5F1